MRDTLVKSRFGRPARWLGLAALCGAVAAGACKSDADEPDSDSVGEAGNASGGRVQLQDAGNPDHRADAAEASGEGGAAGSDCGASKIKATKRPVNLLLVIDRSASMDTPPRDVTSNVSTLGAAGTAGRAGSDPGDVASQGGAGGRGSLGAASGATAVSDATKWELLKRQLVDSLDQVKADLSLGMLLFPYAEDVEPAELWCEMSTGSSVQVPVAEGTESITDIGATLDDTPPAGNTPTAAALEQALQYFTTGQGSEIEGDSYVLLATDGGPNCNVDITCDADTCIPNIGGVDCGGPGKSCCESVPDQCVDRQATTDALASLARAGVKTFIVGIPGSELFSDFLDGFAEAGGMTRSPTTDLPHLYYKVEAEGNMQGLSDVLLAITGQLITSCDLQLEEKPPDVTKLNVYVDGAIVPQAGEDGWTVDTRTSPPTVRIKGKTCQRLETEGAESVSIRYGCPTVILL